MTDGTHRQKTGIASPRDVAAVMLCEGRWSFRSAELPHVGRRPTFMSHRLPRTVGVVGVAITSVIAFGSCSNDDATTLSNEPVETANTAPTGTESPTPTPTPSTAPSTTPTTELPDPVAILGVYDAVEFYPACGNERLDHLDQTWFQIAFVGFDPIVPELQDEVNAVLAVEREEPPVPAMQGVARVAAPGPGDDTGTLVIWADGVARWVSASGDLDVWMIDDEVPYLWVC